MNIQLLFFILCFLHCFISCTQNKNTEQLPNSIIVFNQDVNSKQYDAKETFRKSMKEKQYSFYSHRRCDSTVSLQDIKKHRKNKIFNGEKEIVKDSIYIKITFIDDCCQNYIGYLNFQKDTIKLSYENISSTLCDCYCKYFYTFSLPKKNYEGKNIFLNNKKYQ
jgi:hypothetical protein